MPDWNSLDSQMDNSQLCPNNRFASTYQQDRDSLVPVNFEEILRDDVAIELMDLVSTRLKFQFGITKGLYRLSYMHALVCKGDELPQCEVIDNFGVQIHYVNYHYLVSYQKDDEIVVLDSLRDSLRIQTIMPQLRILYQSLKSGRKNIGDIIYRHPQSQGSTVDCGPFAIANAFCVLSDQVASTFTLDQRRLRAHIYQCLQQNFFTNFPCVFSNQSFISNWPNFWRNVGNEYPELREPKQRLAQGSSHDGGKWSAIMSALTPSSQASREEFQGEQLPEMTKADDDAFIDDLPLGSEANTISPVVTTESSLPTPPQDARLAQIRGTPGTGTPVWSSFQSEVSAQTSASSANSLDILLSQRNVDPVHMLQSLGFDYIHEQVPPMLRVPQRFIKESSAKGIDIERYLEDYPELKQKLKKQGWRGLSKSISTISAMISKSHRRLAEPNQGTQQADNHNINNNNNTFNNNNNSNNSGSSPVIDDDLLPCVQSILIPENQKALAEQGFYDRKVSRKVEKQEPARDAASKRERFRGTKRWSFVDEPNEELSDSVDLSQSLDEQRGRSSTGFSSSMDSSESPGTDSSNSEICRQLEEEIMRVGELWPPESGDFSITPSTSKQNTIEKASTLTEEDKDEGKHVRIVVSDSEANAAKQTEDQTDAPKFRDQTLLTIVNTQMDRLSDSGSDHTLVDTPRFSGDADPSHPPLTSNISKDSVFEESERMEKISVSCQTSIDSGQLDENDNRSSKKRTNGKNAQEDLPRMASVQSDSSGFGDADNTADIATEIDKSLMSSLGSSSESAGTLASSNTAILMPDVVSDMATQTSMSEQERNTLTIPSIRLPSGGEHSNKSDTAQSGSEASRYVTTVYIPEANRIPASPTIIKQDSNSIICGKGLVLGKHRVSIVVQNQSQSSSEDHDHGPEHRSHFVRKTSNTVNNRAPLAQPEEYDSDETGRNSCPPSHVSELKLRVFDSPYGSQISLADGGSDYSYSSLADSTASCSTSEILDYRKLVRLINHPVSHKGRKQAIIRYRPKKHIRDWPSLIRKRRIQEETRLLQHALHKYKTDLHSLETTCLLQYQLAYEDLTDEEREEVEELQELWTEVHKQVQTMEQLLSHRMKSVTKGNDFFTFLSSLDVIHRMTELLKEQMYQQTVSSCLDQEEDDEEEDEEFVSQSPFSLSSPYPHSSFSSSHLPDPSPSLSPSPSHMSGYGSPFGVPRGHQDLQHSMEEMRRSLMEEMKQELNRNTQQLHLDMQAKDNEIQRLNLEIMMQSRGSPRRSRALHLRRSTKESDV